MNYRYSKYPYGIETIVSRHLFSKYILMQRSYYREFTKNEIHRFDISQRLKCKNSIGILFTNWIVNELPKSFFYRLVLFWTNEEKNGCDTWTHTQQFLQDAFPYKTCHSRYQDRSIVIKCFDGICLVHFLANVIFINFYVHPVHVAGTLVAISATE